jgi:hypothetical protein
VAPTGYSEMVLKSAATEKEIAKQMPFHPNYIRIPVTDHCMPSSEALNRFVESCVSLNPGDWVHCHCHSACRTIGSSESRLLRSLRSMAGSETTGRRTVEWSYRQIQNCTSTPSRIAV